MVAAAGDTVKVTKHPVNNNSGFQTAARGSDPHTNFAVLKVIMANVCRKTRIHSWLQSHTGSFSCLLSDIKIVSL